MLTGTSCLEIETLEGSILELGGSGAIVRLLGSSSSRLEPHIDIELGSYLGLLLIHHLCSSLVLAT